MENENIQLWKRLVNEIFDKNVLSTEKNNKLQEEINSLRINNKSYASVTKEKIYNATMRILLKPTDQNKEISIETFEKEIVKYIKILINKLYQKKDGTNGWIVIMIKT